MASYRVVFRRSVAKDLRRIPNEDVVRLLTLIERLADDPRPRGSQKLSVLERYRIRKGVYRIVYEILDDELRVVVVKVAHGREAYRAR